MDEVRRELRSICGRSEPEDEGLVDGLLDSYHDLLVGPCDPKELALEPNCRLVEQVGLTREDEFDCSYAEWTELFREKTRLAADDLSDADRTEVALSEVHSAAVDRALGRGENMELEG